MMLKYNLKKGIIKLYSMWSKVPIIIARPIINKLIDSFLIETCRSFEKISNNFISFRLRPKYSRQVIGLIQYETNIKAAIVMQGPLKEEADFTVETVKLYRKLFPETIIIISTWKDESKEILSQLDDLGVEIVLNDKPKKSGVLNVNFQLVSTKAGVEKAYQMGAQYICKSRTDQRIYKNNSIEYMVNMLKQFPCGNGVISQKLRIITFGMEYGNMFYPYLISDFLYFGHADDIVKLFSINLDDRNNTLETKGKSRVKVAKDELAPEIYIIKEYIRKCGGNTKDTIEQYWNFVKNYLICINKDMIGLYWYKYDVRFMEHIREGLYFPNDTGGLYFPKDMGTKLLTYNFDFINWFNLYCGSLIYDESYEQYKDVIQHDE